jgi:hypothetical protein
MGSRWRGRGVRTAALRPIIIVVALAGAASAIVGNSSNASTFAGYVWTGQVTSVRGGWTVPTVRPHSPTGIAATWIGAEAPGGSNAPFIQIGTNEALLPPDLKQAQLPGSLRVYYAFWSDVVHHFHPVILFQVSPGDSLSATMSLIDGVWTLAISDHTSGSSARLTTRDETHAAFNEALWTQEDVTNGKTNKPFSYPHLTTVAFSGLSVNGQRASAVNLTTQVLSERGTTVTPSPISNDGFTLAQRMSK